MPALHALPAGKVNNTISIVSFQRHPPLKQLLWQLKCQLEASSDCRTEVWWVLARKQNYSDTKPRNAGKRQGKNKVSERNTAPFAAVDTAHDECAAVSEEQAAAPTQPSCSGPSPFITFRADEESDSMALTNP